MHFQCKTFSKLLSCLQIVEPSKLFVWVTIGGEIIMYVT